MPHKTQSVSTSHAVRPPVRPFGPRVRKPADAPRSVIRQKSPSSTRDKKHNVVHVIAPQPYASPAHPKQQQSMVLRRQAVKRPVKQTQEHQFYSQPSVQTGKLRATLQACFGMFA